MHASAYLQLPVLAKLKQTRAVRLVLRWRATRLATLMPSITMFLGVLPERERLCRR